MERISGIGSSMAVIVWIITGLMILSSVVLCAGVIFADRQRENDGYDERQRLARGKAMGLAFMVSETYTIIMVLWELLAGPIPMELHLVLAFGLILQIMVMHTYCMMTDSAFGPKEHPIAISVSYLIAGALQVFTFWSLSQDKSLSFTGEGAKLWWNLLAAITFFYVGVMHLVGHWWHNRE